MAMKSYGSEENRRKMSVCLPTYAGHGHATLFTVEPSDQNPVMGYECSRRADLLEYYEITGQSFREAVSIFPSTVYQ